MDEKLLPIFQMFGMRPEDTIFIKYELPVEIDVVFRNSNQNIFNISGVVGLFALSDHAFIIIKTDGTFSLVREVVMMDVRNL